MRTAEEVKDEMTKKMGDHFGSLFYSLYNEITWLTFKWIEFRELYGSKDSRFELMNKAAPFFFFTVQKVLWENLLLGVARITDPPGTFGKRNVSLRAIDQYIEDIEFKSEFEKDLNSLLTDCEFCRDWRNRWIAHMDFQLVMNSEKTKPLDHASRMNFRVSIEKIQSLYNKVSRKYLGSTTAWQIVRSDRGAISLLYKIEAGLRFDEEQYRKKLNGEWLPDNFESKV